MMSSRKITKRIYMDHAATTPMDSRVKKAMKPFWSKTFGNPNAIYKEGRKAKVAVSKARADIAKILNASAEEIIFTSGGTESDNLAIFGVAYGAAGKLASLKTGITGNFPEAKLPSGFKSKSPPLHVITTKFEHPAVLEPCKFLEKNEFDV